MVCHVGWWERAIAKYHNNWIFWRESEMLVRAAPCLYAWWSSNRSFYTLLFSGLRIITFISYMCTCIARKADTRTPSLLQCLPEKHSLGVISCSVNCDGTGESVPPPPDWIGYHVLVAFSALFFFSFFHSYLNTFCTHSLVLAVSSIDGHIRLWGVEPMGDADDDSNTTEVRFRRLGDIDAPSGPF